MKHCNKCGQDKPLSEFHNDKNSRDGKTRNCKACNNAKSREDGRRRRAEDKDALNAYHRQWMSEHRDRKRIYDAPRQSRMDPEERRAYQTAYRSENPDKIRGYGILRRTRKTGASVCEIVSRLAVAERDHWICQICGDWIDPDAPHKLPDGSWNPRYLHIDHIIPLSKGGVESYANVQAAHATCNIHKSDRLDF